MVQTEPISGNERTTMKNGGCVTIFFHSGPWYSRNILAFETLWLRTTMKNASGVFHSGRARFTVLRRAVPRLEPGLKLANEHFDQHLSIAKLTVYFQ